MIKTRRKTWFYLPLVCGLFLLLLVRQPTVRGAAAEALTLCAATLLPALLPLSVTAKLFLLLGLHEPFARLLARPLRRCFSLPPAAAGPLLTGLLGGYPIGAQSLAAVYRSGTLTRDEARRLSRLCCQAGPAFLVGAVGSALFGSVTVGLLLWLTQLLSACCVGLLFRSSTPDSVQPPQPSAHPLGFGDALTEAVRSSCLSLLTVCGFVVCFGVLRALLESVPYYAMLPPFPAALLGGSMELSSGLFALDALAPFPRFVLAAALSAWGGLCIQLQALAPLRRVGLSGKPQLYGKLLQSLLTVPFSLCLAALLRLPGSPRTPSALAAIYSFPVPTLLFCIFLPNYWKKRRVPVIINKSSSRPLLPAAAASEREKEELRLCCSERTLPDSAPTVGTRARRMRHTCSAPKRALSAAKTVAPASATIR